ncbi:MAG: type I-E CRISPR-associated protein Cas6/Cse3/CasE [Acidobacteriaceae bacterium]|nr:type I-E CRISPR-associated protein Cas6/Cse3/CasE [Acidobacteriaceae bacterium]
MSEYFSRVRLRHRSEISGDDRRWLHEHSLRGEAQLDHELIWKLFPGDDMARDFVFRRELLPVGALKTTSSYLVVSRRRPEAGSMFVVESKPYAPQVAAGEHLCFSLLANPVVSRRTGTKSHRHDVLMDAKKQCANHAVRKNVMYKAALDWLLKRAKDWGLNMHEKTVLMKSYRQHSFSRKGKRVSFSVLDYSGLATVADPDLLRRALTNGVGHERSYGCGLLLVRRAD